MAALKLLGGIVAIGLGLSLLGLGLLPLGGLFSRWQARRYRAKASHWRAGAGQAVWYPSNRPPDFKAPARVGLAQAQTILQQGIPLRCSVLKGRQDLSDPALLYTGDSRWPYCLVYADRQLAKLRPGISTFTLDQRLGWADGLTLDPARLY